MSLLRQSIRQRVAVRSRGSVLVQLLAELVSGRSSASYSRQRRCGVELADGGAESQAVQMLLAAWISWAVEWQVHCGQRG